MVFLIIRKQYDSFVFKHVKSLWVNNHYNFFLSSQCIFRLKHERYCKNTDVSVTITALKYAYNKTTTRRQNKTKNNINETNKTPKHTGCGHTSEVFKHSSNCVS